MEQVVRVAQSLREDHHFRGYIHLKTIPDASDDLIAAAGKYADRLSINIEVPTETSLARLAPEKNVRAIRRTMGRLRLKLDETMDQSSGHRRAPPPASRPPGKHADDHRRGCLERPDHPGDQRQSLRLLQSETGLLLGVQPDPRCEPCAAAASATAGARASAVSGRLADAVLRFRHR